MDKALAVAAKLNSLAAAVAPGSPIAGLVIGMAGFVGKLVQDIKARQATGEDVSDLLARFAEYDAALDELKDANADYFAIPEKVDPQG